MPVLCRTVTGAVHFSPVAGKQPLQGKNDVLIFRHKGSCLFYMPQNNGNVFRFRFRIFSRPVIQEADNQLLSRPTERLKQTTDTVKPLLCQFPVPVIAKIYLKWRNMELFQGVLGSLRPAVVALIASAGISILITAFWGNDMITFAGTNWGLVTIFVICIFLIQKVKMNPVWVMLLAGVMKVGVSCAQRL